MASRRIKVTGVRKPEANVELLSMTLLLQSKRQLRERREEEARKAKRGEVEVED